MSREDEGLRRTVNGQVPSISSTYSALRGQRGMAVQVLFLALDTPERPVAQVNGHIEEVRPDCLVLSLERKLPHLETYIRFGVEVFAPSGLIQFQGRAAEPVVEGTDRLRLALPDKIETIQRRRFARVPFSGQVSYQLVHAGKPLQGWGEGVGVDLSAGGIKLVTASALRGGQALLVSFDTPDGKAYRGLASTVLRVERKADRYVAACRFECLSESLEAALVQSIFRMQVRSGAR